MKLNVLLHLTFEIIMFTSFDPYIIQQLVPSNDKWKFNCFYN
jgi:hypothetical protein